MTEPALVVTLANAGIPRRPAHARVATSADPLRDPGAAGDVLAAFLGRAVHERELPALRDLQRAVAAIVEALVDGGQPTVTPLNRIAGANPVAWMLERGENGRLRATLGGADTSAVAVLAARSARELADLDPGRLRRCARHECKLFFYDASRSGTQRWHSERPCGARERQRRHRTARTTTEQPTQVG